MPAGKLNFALAVGTPFVRALAGPFPALLYVFASVVTVAWAKVFAPASMNITEKAGALEQQAFQHFKKRAEMGAFIGFLVGKRRCVYLVVEVIGSVQSPARCALSQPLLGSMVSFSAIGLLFRNSPEFEG